MSDDSILASMALPEVELPQGKVYFSIGEVAAIIGESDSCVRYWSNEFSKIVKPTRNKKQNRLYSRKDVQSLVAIRYLVKVCGMTINGAKAKLADEAKTGAVLGDAASDVSVKAVVVHRLEEVRDSLNAILRNL